VPGGEGWIAVELERESFAPEDIQMLHKCHDASTQRRIADLLQDYKDKQSVNKGSMVFIQYGKPPELSRNLKEALVMLLTASGSTEIHRLMPPKPKKRVRKNDKDGEVRGSTERGRARCQI
jgi:hypothetical protein